MKSLQKETENTLQHTALYAATTKDALSTAQYSTQAISEVNHQNLHSTELFQVGQKECN